MQSTKDTMNSKEQNIKVPASVTPRNVLAEVYLAMAEGAMKYGRHNFRGTEVRASTYFDAAHRHLDAFWEGEDNDPDSGLNHVVKAIANLIILRDVMVRGDMKDDRPPPSKGEWQAEANTMARAFKW